MQELMHLPITELIQHLDLDQGLHSSMRVEQVLFARRYELTLSLLCSTLTHAQPRGRWWAVAQLGELDDDQSIEPLFAALRDPEPWFTLEVGEALGNKNPERTLDSLLTALTDTRATVRLGAAYALALQDDTRGIAELVALFKAEAFPPASTSHSFPQAEALRRLGNPATTVPMLELLTSESPIIRAAVASILGETHDARATQPLVALLTDPDHTVRWQTAMALGRQGDRRAIPALMVALSDDSILSTLILTLGYLEATPAAPELWRIAKSDMRVAIAHDALYALGKISSPAIVDDVIAAITAGTLHFEPDDLFSLLVPPTGNRAIPLLCSVVRDTQKTFRARYRATRTLGALRAYSEITLLRQLLDDAEGAVRYEAAVALGKMGDVAALPRLRIMAQSDEGRKYSDRVADAAATAVARITAQQELDAHYNNP